jgi:hypothetical protein
MYHKTLHPEDATDDMPGETPGTAMVPAQACTKCGAEKLSEQGISIAFFHGANPCLIRDIPALVCGACGEEFINDDTAMKLDMMRGKGFDSADALETIKVPVFAFNALGTAGRVR